MRELTEMEKDLEMLLSCIHTDANMAIEDVWDRGDDGFEAQIESINDFCSKHKLAIGDNR